MDLSCISPNIFSNNESVLRSQPSLYTASNGKITLIAGSTSIISFKTKSDGGDQKWCMDFHFIVVSYTDLHDKYPAGLDSVPELPDLMNEVAAKVPSKWRDVGLQLGVDQSILDGITTISQGDTNLCYSNVFTRWKNQNSTTHPYTWSTIVQALQTPAVGEERLADKIKNKLSGH